MGDYPELSLSIHNSGSIDFSTIFTRRAYITLNNITAIDKLKSTVDNKSVLIGYHEQVHALLEVQIRALENLIQLQESWIANVEDDPTN
jgi:hypothetical protein